MSKAITVLLDRLVAAELRVAEVSQSRAEIASELTDLQGAYNELDERNTVLHYQQAEMRKRCEDFEALKARVAELSVAGHAEIFMDYGGEIVPMPLEVLSVNSSNGKTTIRVRWPPTT